MSTGKFKVGDKVKILSHLRWCSDVEAYISNNIYRSHMGLNGVIDYVDDNDRTYRVLMQQQEGIEDRHYWWAFEEQLRLVL